MWLAFAVGSAGFAGLTAVLAKVGIRGVDSTLATALRTVVVVIFSWLMVFIVGSANTLPDITFHSFIFLILSGLATGASWLCYFRALQIGSVNKVTPVDKSSTILAMLLAFIFLGETLTVLKGVAMVGIAAGTLLMIERKDLAYNSAESRSWFFFAALSALFAALTSILGKIGIQGVESNLGTAIRTIVVLIMAWGIVIGQRKYTLIKGIDQRSWLFIGLSGIATGLSWLCYYRALQEGSASIVVPIDKLSIVVTVAFSFFFLKESISRKALLGLALIVCGTLLLLV
ncbi:MAG: EamA family transporter [Chloroflexi bacterium]|nr:EamA family transporter [Chloroflexota bacterium]MCC6894773.1 EamA family transporter [Anaerolineae bacterium]